jgi:hypothetical protein
MQNFLDELASLIVSGMLIIMLTLLLIFKILPASDSLVSTVITALIAFWLLRSAFKWQPPAPKQ